MPSRVLNLFAFVFGLALIHATAAPIACGETAGFNVPPGFHVSLVADDSLAHDVFAMTLDAQGRVVVSGPGYIKILHDDDADGRADRAALFAGFPNSGAQGLCFVGDDLYFTGDGGLRRVSDADHDGRADGESELLVPLNGGEHGGHAIVHGPDGLLYVVCGNSAGVDDRHVTVDTSPVKEPLSGAVLRVSLDGREREVYADGFRNPYRLAITATGHLFDVDSDGERVHHLPWYAPTRLFDIGQGREHGWIETGWKRSWSRPEEFFDNVERTAEMGRGSPTGLVAYRHRQFPDRYRDGLFAACWTFGRVYFLPLERRGASFVSRPEIFIETTGDVGFAPVDLAVSPAGDLLVAIGGRGTRGGVFRVTYGDAEVTSHGDMDDLQQVLLADQPLTAWSRADWVPAAGRLGPVPFQTAAADGQRSIAERLRAVEVLTELFDGVTPELARQIIATGESDVTARVAWALGRREYSPIAAALLAELTRDADPFVCRAAWDSLATMPEIPDSLEPAPNWRGGLQSADRRIRSAMLLAARGPGSTSFRNTVGEFSAEASPYEALGHLRFFGPTREDNKDWTRTYWRTCADIFATIDDAALRFEVLRLMQLGLGDVLTARAPPDQPIGFVGQSTEQIDREIRQDAVARLAPLFPTACDAVNRELGRLLAMLGAEYAPLLDGVAREWSPESSPDDDVHYLMILGQLPGARSESVTRCTARALADLHAKLAARDWHPSRTWPERVGETFDNLCHRDPALARALIDDPHFGRAEHCLFAEHMTPADKQAAAAKLIEAQDETQQDVTSQWVNVVATLPREDVLPVLRRQWDNIAVRDTITPILAAQPEEEDRGRFVDALLSTQAEITEQAAKALTSLDAPGTPREIGIALLALREYCLLASDPSTSEEAGDSAFRSSLVSQTRPVRLALTSLLAHWTGHVVEIGTDQQDGEPPHDDSLGAYDAWLNWYSAEHPDGARQLVQQSGADVTAWEERLAKIDFAMGDANRGRDVFAKRSCQSCHGGNRRLGPDLAGAAARMDRDDLFAAIVDPHRDVAPTYRSYAIVTTSGKIYNGLLVYESPDGTLLQTGADTTVRITGEEFESKHTSRRSIMPTGLLDSADDRELADLYAYLKSIGPNQQ